MDKLADAIAKLVETGTPLAKDALYYWFLVHGFDALSNVLVGLVVVGGLLIAVTKILSFSKWYHSNYRDG